MLFSYPARFAAAGKTSLVRTLSGEEFMEQRTETHEIDTSMVEMTELYDSWHVVELNKSYVDYILADKVCLGIKDSPRSIQSCNMSSSSEPGPSYLTKKPPGMRKLPSTEGPPKVTTLASFQYLLLDILEHGERCHCEIYQSIRWRGGWVKRH